MKNNTHKEINALADFGYLKGKGFASFTPEKLKEVASLGGKSAWKLGRAHRFTKAEAKAAGRKGGRFRRKMVI